MEIRRVSAIGGKAHAALRSSGGIARVLAPCSASAFAITASEIVWIGAEPHALHPRAVICDLEPACAAWAEGGSVRITSWPEQPWRPPVLPPGSALSLPEGARRLLTLAPRLGPPMGFGTLLLGTRPAFPLDAAAEDARELARACAAGEPSAARSAALALLGLGSGLTPSGDDYVGAAFFARALVTAPESRSRLAWLETADAVGIAARQQTHPISAALLCDLLDGLGHAALHELALALALGAATARVLEAGRRLVSLGHASGWDMLAGFVAGTGAIR